MNRARLRVFLSLLIGLLSLAGTAGAQVPIEPAKLPARTIFYLAWRGMPAGDVRKANSLFALWDDPALAPAREAMAENIVNSSNKDKSTARLSRAELDEFASFFDNSYILGYLPEPKGRAAAASSDAKKPQWNGLFFVYDHTGKEALMLKALLGLRLQKDPPQASPTTIAGVPATKFTSKDNSFYWADKGKFTIAAGERSIMEEVFSRLDNKTAGPSLGEAAAFQEAQPHLGRGTLEFFLRIPDFNDFVPKNALQGVQAKPILDALRLDAIHSILASVSFEGPKTHLQGAILGDASPGTLFDIFADGQAAPASLAFASADTIYFNSTQINLVGIYATLKRAVASAFPQGQQGNADMIDTLAQSRIGMPVGEALALFSGEFASIQSSPTMDLNKQIYFAGIRNKPQVLKLIRTLVGERISGERNEGDTTFLKVSLGGSQTGAGVAQWNFYNIAVTSNGIIGATRSETLRELLAQRPQNAAGLASSPQFQAARSKFPKTIDGFNFVDFQKFDWPGVKEHWLKELRKASSSSPTKALNGQKATPAPPAALPAWLEQIDPQVFARHLHSAFAASWKDAKGVHFEEWLD
jgi:hypothetical protein